MENDLQLFIDDLEDHHLWLNPQKDFSEEDAEKFISFHMEVTWNVKGRRFLLFVYFKDLLSIDCICVHLHHINRSKAIEVADAILLGYSHIVDYIDLREQRKRPGKKYVWSISLRYPTKYAQ